MLVATSINGKKSINFRRLGIGSRCSCNNDFLRASKETGVKNSFEFVPRTMGNSFWKIIFLLVKDQYST